MFGVLLLALCPHVSMGLFGGPYRTAIAQVDACPRARAALGDDVHLGWFGFPYGSSFGSSGGFRVPVAGSKASGDLTYHFDGADVSWSLQVTRGGDYDSRSCNSPPEPAKLPATPQQSDGRRASPSSATRTRTDTTTRSWSSTSPAGRRDTPLSTA